MDINLTIKDEFNLTEEHTKNIISLLDEGNTIPFIARYRKELTGHIDDQVLRDLSDRLTYLRNLEKRKEEVKNAIEEQGKLTDKIVNDLINAGTLTEVEDIYRPYKQKKETKATKAIANGLEPLADIIMAQEIMTGSINDIAKPYINKDLGVKSEKDALDGAKAIIAERVSDDAELRKKLRRIFLSTGEVTTKAVVKKADTKDKDIKTKSETGVYDMYADYSEAVCEIKSHRVLAINRGESDGLLKVKVAIDKDFALRVCSVPYIKQNGSITTPLVIEAIKDGYEKSIYPSVEREIRNVLTDKANEQAIKMFEVNLEPLLMQPPVKDKITMGFDPAYRTGCKIAVVDEMGKVLDKTVVYPTPPQSRVEEAKKVLIDMINKHKVDVISIGNGTASKESEIFVADLIKSKELNHKVEYIVVSEAGASVYSASKLGAEEFPDYDVSERSAVSIARRLQDPLAELIKIDPKSIGVGQYQHDMPEARLDEVLNGVLESCVNKVGVNLNTASPSLLKFVAGLNAATVKNIVKYREDNGKFTNKKQLLKVSKLGDKVFEQCAGFLRIVDGDEILDNTGVHPESYEQTIRLLDLFGYTKEDVINGKIQELPTKISKMGEEKVAEKIGLGVLTLKDIVAELIKPGRDVRDSLPMPMLRSDIMSINDLKVGMALTGTVRNVIDFGAFIDIGVHQDGLVHISQMSNKYIKHPSEVLKVGDVVTVTVLDVDLKKNRIALTMRQQNKE